MVLYPRLLLVQVVDGLSNFVLVLNSHHPTLLQVYFLLCRQCLLEVGQSSKGSPRHNCLRLFILLRIMQFDSADSAAVTTDVFPKLFLPPFIRGNPCLSCRPTETCP